MMETFQERYDAMVKTIRQYTPNVDMALVDRGLMEQRLSTYFDELSRNIVYKKWYFGSLHKNKRIPRGQCLFTDIVRIS